MNALDATDPNALSATPMSKNIGQWQSFLDRSTLPSSAIDDNFVFTYVNSAFCSLFGFTSAELIGRKISDLSNKPHGPSKKLLKQLKTGEIDNFFVKKNYMHADEGTLHCITRVQGLYDAKGHFIGAHAFIEHNATFHSLISEYKLADDKTRSTLRMAKMGTWEWNVSELKIQWSAEIHQILEVDEEEMGTSIYHLLKLVHPDDKKFVLNVLSRTQGLMLDKPFEFRVVTKSGAVKHILLAGADDTLMSKKVQFGFLQDVTELRTATSGLKIARSTIDNSIAATFTSTADGNITYMNRSARKTWGFKGTSKTHTYKNLKSYFAEEEEETISQLLEATIKNRFSDNLDVLQARKKDGTIFPVQVRAVVAADAQGEKSGITISLEDLSQLQQAQREVLEHQLSYDALLEDMTGGVAQVDDSNIILSCNSTCTQVFGIDRSELVGKRLSDLLMAINAKTGKNGHLPPFDSVQSLNNLSFNIGEGHDDLWISIKVVQLRDAERKSSGSLIFISDITEQKMIERLLKANTSTLRSINENSPDHILILSSDGELTYTNTPPNTSAVGQYSLSTTFHSITPAMEHRIVSCINPIMRGEKVADFEIKSGKHSEAAWASVRIGSIYIDKVVTSVLVIVTDITTRKEAELAKENFTSKLALSVKKRTAELSRSKQKYQLIADNISDWVCLLNAEGGYEFSSPSGKDLTGLESSSMFGSCFFDLCAENYRSEFVKRFDRTLSEPDTVQVIEFVIETSSGKKIWVESVLKSALQADGNLKVQITTRNISARKTAEKEIRDALRSERELSTLKSKFLATASHQFRTPLAVIHSSIELLNLYYEQGGIVPKQYEVLSGRIIQEVQRMTHLMDDVLILEKINSRKESFNPELTNIEKLINSLAEAMAQIQKDDHCIALDVIGNSRLLNIDPRLFSHIFTNLLTNAFKYSKGAPSPLVQIEYKNEYAVLRVQDYGIGIPKEEVGKLFQPFYRANNTEGIQGTGLGLAIIKEYVALLAGTISLESTLDKGTVVLIELPYERTT
jgi:PAS domain S-box-containing protein